MAPQKAAVLDDMTDTSYEPASPLTLPLIGHTRWEKLKYFVAFSRTTMSEYEEAGRFPKRVQLSPRCVAWPNSELHRYFADPEKYRAEKEASAI